MDGRKAKTAFSLQSADPGSDLLLGPTSSLVSPEPGAALSPAPPAPATVTTETNAPPIADGPAPSHPAADTWVTSEPLAPPTAACHSQLIIVEQRGQTLSGERMVRRFLIFIYLI